MGSPDRVSEVWEGAEEVLIGAAAAEGLMIVCSEIGRHTLAVQSARDGRSISRMRAGQVRHAVSSDASAAALLAAVSSSPVS